MDFISEYFYVIILIVGAIAQWVKSRGEAAENAKEAERSAKRQAQQGGETITDWEPAQTNAPRPAVPPPLPGTPSAPLPGVERSPVPQLRKKAATPPPVPNGMDGVMDFHWAELERQQSIAERVNEFKRAKKAKAPQAKVKPNPVASRASAGSLTSRLGSRRELRQAFVLKEILEKPVGLR